jgi:penicillin G amidase
MAWHLGRWFFRLLIFVDLPLLILLGALWLWLETSLPQTEGQVILAGPQAPIEILRDRYGIPHIFAQSEADGAFALGYVHAQDRLWQMDQARRAGRGRLSELFGEATLPIDRLMRTLGVGRLAEAAAARLDGDTRVQLESYTAGVNGYIQHHRGLWPPEFLMLSASPEPWLVSDSLVAAKLIALQLSGHHTRILERARLLKRLSPAEVDQLWPAYPDGAATTFAQGGGVRELADGLPLAALATAFSALGRGGASNAWAVDGAHSETGKPLLANDPHSAFSLPVAWYLATIDTPALHLAGATTPGLPALLLGHNDRIAWGWATTGGDVEDFFVERLAPNDPGRYEAPEGERQIASRVETIAIRRAKPESLTVRETRHGPVMSDLFDAPAEVLARGTLFALAAPWLDPASKGVESLFRLGEARDWAGFTAALEPYTAPQENFLYADREGNIGFYTAGAVPLRKAGDGRFPVPGWSGDHDWAGFIPFAALPHALNPVSGRLINANNRVTPAGYPYLITRDGWDPPFRAERIAALLDAAPKASLEGFASIQADHLSLAARLLLPRLLEAVTPDQAADPVIARLRDWDGRMDETRPEPLIFEAWLRELNRGLFAERLGEGFNEFWGLRAELIVSVFADHPAWCAKGGPPAPGDCRARAREAFARAIAWLDARYGGDPNAWRWGEAHRAEFRHRLFHQVPIADRMVDIGFPMGGDEYTVDRASSAIADEAEPFADVFGAGFRAVYDLADLGRSRFIIATGESGNPLSRHFGDLAKLWRGFDYVRLDQDRDALLREGEGRLALLPP